jgi:hypothetical protein
MSEMIERVAKAILTDMTGLPSMLQDWRDEDINSMAKAAIVAMQETRI